MKDLDFDELDRAVNSLISSSPKLSGADVSAKEESANEKEPVAKNIEKEAPILVKKESLKRRETVKISAEKRRESRLHIEPAPRPVEVKIHIPSMKSVPKPSTGRFMDVVHTSSDMKTAPVLTGSARKGMEVSPIITKPEVAKSTTVVKEVNSVSAPIYAPMPSVPSPVASNAVVEPPVHVSVAPDEDDDIDQINDDISKTLGKDVPQQSSIDSLETPFIANPKVDKRPLNPVPTDTTPKLVSSPQINDGQSAVRFDSVNTTPRMDTPFPAELQDELLQIESDSTTNPEIEKPDVSNAAVAATAATAAMAEPISDNEEELPPQEPEKAPKSVEVSDTPKAPTSINQQYTESPSSGDQSNGAIYDSNNFRSTLLSIKKKPGWIWAIVVIVLSIAGIGVGVVAYLLITTQ